MKQEDRLKEIENKKYERSISDDEAWADFNWLFLRVKRLTEALEKIESMRPDEAEYNAAYEARKALAKYREAIKK